MARRKQSELDYKSLVDSHPVNASDPEIGPIPSPPHSVSPRNRHFEPRAKSGTVLPTPSRPPTASVRQKAARASTVRERLNLPPIDNDGAQLEPARDVMAAYTLYEAYDTRPLQDALKHRATLVGDVAVVGLAGLAGADPSPPSPPAPLRHPSRQIESPAAAPSSSSPSSSSSSTPLVFGVGEANALALASPASLSFELLLPVRRDTNDGPPVAFFFPFGCAVLWGFTEAETTELFAAVEPFALKPLDEGATDEDRIAFSASSSSSSRAALGGSMDTGDSSSSSSSSAKNEGGNLKEMGEQEEEPSERSEVFFRSILRLPSHDRERGEVRGSAAPTVRFETATNLLVLGDALDPLAKLAVSYAFAQSGRLAVLELGLESLSEQVRPIPESLAATGTSHYSRADIGKLIGHTFLLSSTVNLYTDILDEPDFFWENDEYFPIYNRAVNHLDVADRTQILNKRLEIVTRLLESLNTQLATEHFEHLEWIIIWLIAIQFALELMRGGHSFFGLGSDRGGLSNPVR